MERLADNTTTIDFSSVSRDGKYIAYGLSHGGDEMATLYIKDVDTNENLADEIPRCRYSKVRWLPDNSGFFYTRNPRAGEVPENEAHLHTKVYIHKLGDDVANDELIFGKDRPMDDMIGISSVSPNGKYISINVSQKWTENDIYVYDLETKEVKPLITGLNAKSSLRFLEDKALLDTNHKANNYRILSTPLNDLFKPIGEWNEMIPEREHLLQRTAATKSKFIIEYLVNASSQVVMFDHDGNELGELPLPPYSSFAGISTNREEEEFFYGVDSFIFPKITYRYNPLSDSYDVYRKTDNPINPDEYTVKQEWFESKDGTKVPMFMFHRKDAVGSEPMPTILYGYGGFGNSDTPAS